MKFPREKVVVGMPVHNCMIDVACVNGLIACAPFYLRPINVGQNAYVSLARDHITHIFLHRTTAEWLTWIDADTGFTPDDWMKLYEGDDLIVCGAYARKLFGAPPVQWGLGFTRVHRSVYETLAALTTEDGQDRLPRFYYEGEMMIHFHPQGIFGPGSWGGEDQGFFLWAREAKIPTRFETRTQLKHAGRYEFGFPCQMPIETMAKLLQQLSPDDRERLANLVDADGGAN